MCIKTEEVRPLTGHLLYQEIFIFSVWLFLFKRPHSFRKGLSSSRERGKLLVNQADIGPNRVHSPVSSEMGTPPGRVGGRGPILPWSQRKTQAIHQESSVLRSCPKSSQVLLECVSRVGRVMGWASRGVGRAGAPCPGPALIPCLNLTGFVFSRDLSWLSLSWMDGTNALQRVLWLWPAGPMQLNIFNQPLSLCHSETSDSPKNAQNENIYFSFLSSGARDAGCETPRSAMAFGASSARRLSQMASHFISTPISAPLSRNL